MVRRTSRSGVKSLEKSKTESPTLRRSRRRKKSTSSEESDSENYRIKQESPSTNNRESLRRSKRNTSANNDSIIKDVDRGSPAREEHQEFGEGENLKGKSKGSSNDKNQPVVSQEIENETVQVTSQSPSNDQTVVQNVFDKSRGEEECTKSENKICDKIADTNQQMEANSNETTVTDENNQSEKDVLNTVETPTLKELTVDNQENEAKPQLEPTEESQSDVKNNIDKSEIIEKINEPLDHNVSQDKSGSNEDFKAPEKVETDTSEPAKSSEEPVKQPERKKILLKRPKERTTSESFRDETSRDLKETSGQEPSKEQLERSSNEQTLSENQKTEQSEDLNKKEIQLSEKQQESTQSESPLRKKITLKRLPDTKSPGKAFEEDENKKQEESVVEWGSTYEKTEQTSAPDKEDKNETEKEVSDENRSKKVSLNRRATVDDRKLSLVVDKKLVENEDKSSLERRLSLQETITEKRRKSSSGDDTNEEKKKRHSIVFEKRLSESEDKVKPKKPTKIVKIIRTVENKKQSPDVGKKYKWGTSEVSTTKLEPLSFESLKKLCPKLDFLTEEEVNLDLSYREKRQLEIEKRKEMVDAKREEREKMEMDEVEEEIGEVEVKENVIAMNRRISIVDDTASKMKPPPSPPKNPISNVIFITNLVRPFTVKQLKELLERTGKIAEDGFWTDKIKSKCYVKYETLEEAEATRNALHGVNWPIGNGKKLIIEYSTEEEMENAKNPPPPVRKEKTPEKEKIPEKLTERERMDERDAAERTAPTRTWDIGKEENHRKRSRSTSRTKERVRKHSRRSYTPEDFYQKKRKHEEPVPQKAMDDLFLKTKATPSIYWQPLSPEEIALKQQQRQMRMEEHKRRLEESGRGRGGARDHPRDRDRNFRRR